MAASPESTSQSLDCTGSEFAGACSSDSIEQSFDFGPLGIVHTVVNIIVFVIGAFSVITWLPGIIVGIILLANRKPVPLS